MSRKKQNQVCCRQRRTPFANSFDLPRKLKSGNRAKRRVFHSKKSESKSKEENLARNKIREKILAGWVLVTGNDNLIESFEATVYPPGTSKNSDFLVYFGRSLSPIEGKIGYLYLAKKNEDLHRFLKRFDKALTDDQWERTIRIKLVPAKLSFANTALIITYATGPTIVDDDIENLLGEIVKGKTVRK